MKLRFENGALVMVACLVSGLIAAVVLNPLDRDTVSPRASLRLAVSQPVPAPVSPVFSSPLLDGPMIGVEIVDGNPVSSLSYGKDDTSLQVVGKMAGIDTLTGVFSINAIERYHRLLRMKTSVALSNTFKQLGYDLDRVGSGKADVPRLFLASLPGDIRKIPETHTRKALFFKTVLPLMLQANEEILRDRRRLWNIHFQTSLGQKPVAVDRLWLTVITERYGLKSASIETLLKRVDIIPPSLALAQAAEESGWGTSRFVREGNAIFGQWTFSETRGLVPANRDADKQHRVRAFSSLLDSVRAYAHNLNTHRAYRKLRRLRHSLRLKGAPVEGMLLVDDIKSYSQRGEKYVQTIRGLIVSNNLHRLDDARLYNGTPKPRPLI
ncbi:MAG: glucosaminidase domain-containing protein [Rhodospirillales bacterium]|nr:glucosaminidase domain-containing protein [Alphaproteobacteria bacterium]MBL6948411.1 glucosaminidase domain-containing protein [Rhodospirillales bacterium]